MKRKYRVIREDAILYSDDELKNKLADIPIGSIIILGDLHYNKKIVSKFASFNGLNGYVYNIKVIELLKASILEERVEVKEKPDSTSATKIELKKGDIITLDDLIVIQNVEWTKIILENKETGYITGKPRAEIISPEGEEFKYLKCKISNTPIAKSESVSNAISMQEVFQGSFRDADIMIEDGEFVLSAYSEVFGAVNLKEIIRLNKTEILSAELSILSSDKQTKSTFIRSLSIGGGLAISIFIILFLRAEEGKLEIGGSLIFSLILGFAMGLIFNFLPNLVKQSDKYMVQLKTKDNSTVQFFVESNKKEFAEKIFNFHKIPVINKQTS